MSCPLSYFDGSLLSVEKISILFMRCVLVKILGGEGSNKYRCVYGLRHVPAVLTPQGEGVHSHPLSKRLGKLWSQSGRFGEEKADIPGDDGTGISLLSPIIPVNTLTTLSLFLAQGLLLFLNPLTPNNPYRGRTASLTSKVAFYIFIQQI